MSFILKGEGGGWGGGNMINGYIQNELSSRMGSAQQTQLILREQDVVKLACEFLENREMNITQIALER